LMHEKPKLQCTRDYSIFEMHPMNRNLSEKPALKASMKAHGFMPSSPIQCVRNGRGTLRVIRGHNRLDLAKRLKLPIWYVIDDSSTDIYELEGDSSQRWSVLDFVQSRAKAGDKHCTEVLTFQKKHQLPLAAAINLLAGEGSGSGNAVAKVKRGTFRIATDLKHAEAVVDVTDHFRTYRVATTAAFVNAVSRVLRVPECDPKVLKHRISQTPTLFQKRTSTEGYLEELEALYNYAAKGKRLPLKFRAAEVGRQLQFGGRGAR